MPYLPPPLARSGLRARALGALLLLAGVGGCVDAAAEHRVRANAFLRGGDAAAALKECDDGLAAKKGNVPLLILRGKALFELDRLDEARDAYKTAVAAAKGEPPRSLAEAYLGLAMIGSRQKDWAAAREHFGTLVSINDKDATSHLNVARACLELKDLACAVDHAETAGKLRGDEEGVLFTEGTIYLAAGKSREAELTFQHICDVVPGAASCPYGLSLVAARAGDKAKALEQLGEAVKRKLPNPERIPVDPGFASIKDDPEFQRIAARAAHP
jgi:tetratricopeptide (TPR) repeat protein